MEYDLKTGRQKALLAALVGGGAAWWSYAHPVGMVMSGHAPAGAAPALVRGAPLQAPKVQGTGLTPFHATVTGSAPVPLGRPLAVPRALFSDHVVVRPGDNTWGIVKAQLMSDHTKLMNGKTFSELTPGQQGFFIDSYDKQLTSLLAHGRNNFGFASGNIDTIQPGNVLDLSALNDEHIRQSILENYHHLNPAAANHLEDIARHPEPPALHQGAGAGNSAISRADAMNAGENAYIDAQQHAVIPGGSRFGSIFGYRRHGGGWFKPSAAANSGGNPVPPIRESIAPSGGPTEPPGPLQLPQNEVISPGEMDRL